MDTPSEHKEETTRSEQQERIVEQHAMLKLDPNGFPLRPQPTDDPMGMSTLNMKCKQ